MILQVINFIIFLFFNFAGLNNNVILHKEVKDSTDTRIITSGVKHIHVVKKQYPWSINVIEINLKNKNLTFDAVKGKDRIYDSRETVSGMVNRKKQTMVNVISAINADFFDMKTGNIESNHISNNEFVKGVGSRKSQIGITNSNVPFIERFNFSGKIYCRNRKSIDINTINTRRGKDSLVFYNHYWGNSTKTNSHGKEFSLKPVNGWLINQNIKLVVLEIIDSNAALTEGNAVISGDGGSGKFLQSNIKIGDTLIAFLGTSPIIKSLKALVGGLPQIIKDGKDISGTSTKQEGGSEKFIITRHPRTAIGFNREKTKLFFVTVDGRQQSSAGMSLPELSEFMLSLGCYQAINLDGGGSTTMVLQDKIINSPSDVTGERPIGNAFLLIEKK
jgi:exopolysaccharide biosynthesis protein